MHREDVRGLLANETIPDRCALAVLSRDDRNGLLRRAVAKQMERGDEARRDYYAASRLAMRYLMDQGHSSIAYIGSNSPALQQANLRRLSQRTE